MAHPTVAQLGREPYLFNPREETLQFLENILGEVIELFPAASSTSVATRR